MVLNVLFTIYFLKRLFHFLLVIRAKILKDRWRNELRSRGGYRRSRKPRYDILISAVWKGHESVQNVFNASETYTKTGVKRQRADRWVSHIYTSPSSCTVPLEVNTKYILTGVILQNRFYMSACHWRTISNRHSKSIRKLFKTGVECGCEIQSCYGQFCRQGVTSSSCLWDLNYNIPPCKFQICRKGRKFCEWSKNVDIDICENLDNS